MALTYRLLGRLMGRTEGLLAMALLAVAPAAVIDGATVRDFTFGALLSTLSWVFLLERTTTRKAWRPVAIALTTAAALFTWYFHGITLLLQGALALVGRRDRGPLAIGALLASPWYLAVFAGWVPRYQTERFGSGLPTKDTVDILARADGAGRSLLGDLPGIPGGIAPFVVWLALAFAGLVILARTGRTKLAGIALAGAGLGLAFTVVIAWQWGGADFVPRYFHPPLMYGLPALVAVMMAFRWRPALPLMVVCLPGLLLFVNFQALKINDGSRQGLAAFVNQRARAGDVVLSDNFEDLGYLLLASRGAYTADSLHASGASYWFDGDVSGRVALAKTTKAGSGTVWWVRQAVIEQRNAEDLEGELYRLLRPLWSARVQKRRVTAFAGDHAWTDLHVAYAGAPTLDAADHPTRLAECADIPVTVWWTSPNEISADLAAFVHLIDSAGRRVGQDDHDLTQQIVPAGRSSWIGWHIVRLTEAAQPGDYRLVLGVYDDNRTLSTQAGQQVVELGRIRLEAACPPSPR